jgi:phage protein U
MASVMMALGKYRFSIDAAAYQSLQRSTSYRWPAQERIGRAPALQFLGPGEDKITLGGTIFPHYRGGLGQMDALREEAGRGEPLLLVDGRGNVRGRFVVERVAETQSHFFADGTPRRIEFTIELASYGDDGEPGAAGRLAAPGGAGASPAVVGALPSGIARPRTIAEIAGG